MAESDHQVREDPIPQDVQNVIRALISSMRATRLYPENNPVHQQAIQRSFELLSHYLQTSADLTIGVHKTDFLFQSQATSRGVQLYKGISSDLFSKGVREITLKRGITKDELRKFYAILAIPIEEMRQRNSIRSLAWEQGLAHVAVQEAELSEVVLDDSSAWKESQGRSAGVFTLEELRKSIAERAIDLFGKKVMLTDLIADPGRFGAMMIDIANQSGTAKSLRDNRLFDLYRDVGRQIMHTSFEERQPLFDALAESILGMDPTCKDALVAGKLYHGIDAETVMKQQPEAFPELPGDLHELLSARFSRAWTVPQVASLLEKAAMMQFEPAAAEMERSVQTDVLASLAREMAEYTPEEMESLRTLGVYTGDDAVIESVVKTLIHILPHVKNPFVTLPRDKSLNLFSGVVGHLEEMLGILIEKKKFTLALMVLRAFRTSVDPLFQPRLLDAVRRAGDRRIIARLVDHVRSAPKDAPDVQAISSFLMLLDREVTPLLLEMLAEEQDRSLRNLLIRILKELGKTQLALLGERLSDERWYFVRNIVIILGESRREEVVAYLEKVAGHRNFHIRQEVVRALLTIKGERSVRLLTKFLADPDIDIRFMAVRGLGMSLGSGAREEQALIGFLKGKPFRRPSVELRVEAITSLGKVGGASASAFLGRFTTVRWWKAKRTQLALKAAADRARADIMRRIGNAGRLE